MLLFWPFDLLFLALWAFMCFYFALLGLSFFSFLYFGLLFPFILFCSLCFILVFWAFIYFYYGVLAMPLAIPLDTLLDTHECQKCTPSLDTFTRLSLYVNVLAFSCIFQFVPAFVLMAVVLYLKRSSHCMC